MHKKNNVDITKKTHAGRHYAAHTARAHGASASGTKALGGWNESGSFTSVYDRVFPLDALMGAAMYNARRPEEYTLPRDHLGKHAPMWSIRSSCSLTSSWTAGTVPPPELVKEIFPFVEDAQHRLSERTAGSPLAIDISLKQFLCVLQWFRTVILQDCAVLYVRRPDLPIFQFRPFNTPRFKEFAAASVNDITRAEGEARLAFENLPEHVICSLRGLVTTLTLEQQAQRAESETLRAEVRTYLEGQNALLAKLAHAPKARGHGSKSQATSGSRGQYIFLAPQSLGSDLTCHQPPLWCLPPRTCPTPSRGLM
jgi:hypothetical protein